MRATLIALSMVSAALLVSAASNAPTHSHLMMVVSKGLPGVTLYDADTEEPYCRATMGISPHEAAFSLDGTQAYVPVYGSSGVGAPGTDEHLLHFIRTQDCSEIIKLDTGDNKRPHGIAVGPKTGNIYLTTEVSKSLLLIDPRHPHVIAAIPTGSPYSHMIAVTKDEKTVYVSNVMSKTVSVLDVPDRKLAQEISTPVPNQRMTLSPDGRWFVTNLEKDHQIAFFRTADNQLDFTVPVDGDPFVSHFSADGTYLYDAGTEHGKVKAWKINVAQRKAVASVADLGSAIGALTVNPFNSRVYVSDSGGSKINEIDPDNFSVAKVLKADKTCDAMLFATVQH